MEDTNNKTNNKTRIVSLTVPPNAEAGVDSLTFEYEGNELEVLVPAGSVSGDVLQIQVGVKDDNNNNNNNIAKDKNDTDEKNAEVCSKDTKPSSRSSLMDELGGLKDDVTSSTSLKPDTDTKMPMQLAENGITTISLPNATASENETTPSLELLEALPEDDKHVIKEMELAPWFGHQEDCWPRH